MNKKLNSLLGFLLLVIICSCNSLDNRESIAKEEILKQIEEQSKGNLKLQSFEKADGKEYEGEEYKLNFKGKILILNDCSWPVGSSLLSNYGRLFQTFEYSTKKDISGITDDGTILMDENKTSFRENDVIDFSGIIYFEKKESGWQLYKMELEPKI